MAKKQKQLDYGILMLVCLIIIIITIGFWFVSEMDFRFFDRAGRISEGIFNYTGNEELEEELKFDILEFPNPIEKLAEKIENMEYGEWLNFQTKFPKTFEGIKNLW